MHLNIENEETGSHIGSNMNELRYKIGRKDTKMNGLQEWRFWLGRKRNL